MVRCSTASSELAWHSSHMQLHQPLAGSSLNDQDCLCYAGVVSFSARLIAGKSRQQTNQYSRRLSVADDVHQMSIAVYFDQDIMPDERAFNIQHTVQAVNSLHLHKPTTAGGYLKSTRPESLYPRLPLQLQSHPIVLVFLCMQLHVRLSLLEQMLCSLIPLLSYLLGPRPWPDTKRLQKRTSR